MTMPASYEAIENWKRLHYGLFIHYGLFSLAGGVWRGKPITFGYTEQILSHGNIGQYDYEALADSFTAEHFDARSIAKLAKSVGMRYIVLTSKHHDGFCLFKTSTTNYNTFDRACKRDLVGEMASACAEEGLAFGIYYSWIDWHMPEASPISDHNSDPISPEHMEWNMQQLTELLGNYGPIVELWMDMGHPTVEQSEMVANLARNLQPHIMINGRIWNDRYDFVSLGDNKLPDRSFDVPWETPASMYHETWGYRSWQVRGDIDRKIAEIISSLSQVTTYGGNYLLNIGPMGDGSVVPFERQVLEGVGEWVKGHHEALFDNEPSPIGYHEWGAATMKNKDLYLHFHSRPSSHSIEIPWTTNLPTKVNLLEGDAAIPLEHQSSDGRLRITIPNSIFTTPVPIVKLNGVGYHADAAILPVGGGLVDEKETFWRYTGEHYYVVHPIPTRKVWRVVLPAGTSFSVCWKVSSPLDTDYKVFYSDGELSTTCSLRKGRIDGILFETYRGQGIRTFTLRGIGAPCGRTPIPDAEIKLEFTPVELEEDTNE